MGVSGTEIRRASKNAKSSQGHLASSLSQYFRFTGSRYTIKGRSYLSTREAKQFQIIETSTLTTTLYSLTINTYISHSNKISHHPPLPRPLPLPLPLPPIPPPLPPRFPPPAEPEPEAKARPRSQTLCPAKTPSPTLT